MFYKVFRTIRLTAILALALVLPGQALAIGLGEIRLNSPLNEPLDAEIQLFQVQDLDETEVLVSIAPKEDFEAAGVDRLFFLNSLQFTVDLDNPKGPLIHVKTQEPVREPYLNFLVEVQWPSGRLLREYTLLMDLPTFSETRSAARTLKAPEAAPVMQPAEKPALDVQALEAELAAVEAASVQAAAPVVPATSTAPSTEPAPAPAQPAVEPAPAPAAEEAVAAAPAPAPTPEPAPAPAPAAEEAAAPAAPAAPQPAVAETPAATESAPVVVTTAPAAPVFSSSVSAEDYSTQAGDNLWTIAVKYRQANGCTAREYACADGVTVQQAMMAIQRLNPDAFIKGNINLLKKGKVLRMPTQDQVTDVTSREAVAEVARQNIEWSGNADGRKTATPAVEQMDATRQEAEVAVAPVEAEDGQLKLSVPGAEQVAKGGQAGDANKARLESLQNELAIGMEEIDRSKREKNDIKSQMGALDEQAQTMQQMLEVRSAELAALQKSLAAKQQEAAAPAPAEELAPAESTDVDASDVTGVPAVEETQAPAEETPVAEEAKAPAPESSSFLMDNLILILGGVGTLVIGAVVVLVLRKRKSAEPKQAAESFEEGMLDETPSFTADDTAPADTADHDIEAQHEELLDTAGDFDLDVAAEEPVEEAKPETGDAISEADIYISFGTYDKAESLLKAAIASEPKRTDLRLKLLEVYAAMDNLAAFDNQYQELAALGDVGANERAQSMRNNISGAATAAAPAGDDFGLDLDLGGESLQSETIPADDSGLDFDLDLNLDEEPKPKAETSFASNFSQAPTVQQPALDLSQMQTAVSPAVKVSEARTESRPSIDVDLDLDLDLDTDLTSTQSREVIDIDKDLAALDVQEEAPAPAPTVADSGSSVDEEFDFLADADEASTKLDLARAYIDMGDKDGARDILQEVLEEGQDAQKQEAKKLLDSIG